MVTTVFIINTKILREKLIEYSNMTTYSEYNIEYTRKYKQYYLISMDNIFSNTY